MGLGFMLQICDALSLTLQQLI